MSLEAYAAGLFDGEGCIDVSLSKPAHPLSVSICMTSKEPLELLHNHWGGLLYENRRKTITGRTSYQYSLQAQDAWDFLFDIQDWVIVKKDQLNLVLDYPLQDRRGSGAHQRLKQIDRDNRKRIGLELRELRKP